MHIEKQYTQCKTFGPLVLYFFLKLQVIDLFLLETKNQKKNL